MKIDLSGKRAVVAGGSRGIGRAIALSAVRGEIAAYGVTAHAEACDVADADAVAAYIGAAAEALGGIDILVNNASGFGSSHDEAGWARSIDVDLLGTVRATWAAVPFLTASRAGAIINISSISGIGASARTVPYGAVKAALIQYTQSEAAGLARQDIRVNCVAPGSIEFPVAPGSGLIFTGWFVVGEDNSRDIWRKLSAKSSPDFVIGLSILFEDNEDLHGRSAWDGKKPLRITEGKFVFRRRVLKYKRKAHKTPQTRLTITPQ